VSEKKIIPEVFCLFQTKCLPNCEYYLL